MASTRSRSAAKTADHLQLQLQLAPARSAKTAATAIAPAGVIRGGPYDGCPYVLLELRRVGARTYPYVRCPRSPGWPFPVESLVKAPATCQAVA